MSFEENLTAPPYYPVKLVGGIPLDRLRELIRADRDRRCYGREG